MPHRGRLNVLANLMGKPYTAIFSEFQGNPAKPEDVQGSGDVKYHLGTSSDREFDGNIVHLSLTANPSHLEAVNPVVLGKVRAKQAQRGDANREQVMALLMHGDAAFAGQGLVAETLDLSELKGYRTGGTIHFIVNNQIGFTTTPTYSRSGPYCSDVAKIVQAPIFHVNGDDPEAVVHCARIAIEFRQQFKKDVVIDMFCYRRYRPQRRRRADLHPAADVSRIGKHPTRARGLRQAAGRREGADRRARPTQIDSAFREQLENEFNAAAGYKPNKADWLEGKWAGLEAASGDDRRGNTAVPMDLLREVGKAISDAPADRNINRKIIRQLGEKRKMIETGEGIDWATAKRWRSAPCWPKARRCACRARIPAAAPSRSATRCWSIRRPKSATSRSTTSRKDQALFEVIDSPLSEAAVLGFEYGYSLAEPNALVLWEAQFGDFANGAQIIIDQFIASGESKWLRMSGLVMLLPHGYEGQGPEHSSARLERYLQLCAEDNRQVVQLHHAGELFPRAAPPDAPQFPQAADRDDAEVAAAPQACGVEAGSDGAGHHLPPRAAASRTSWRRTPRSAASCCARARSITICWPSGASARSTDVAIVRVEQLYPFPITTVGKELARYPNAEIVWCQEEPANMGAWHFVDRRIEHVLETVEPQGQAARLCRPARGGVARDRPASPARQGTDGSGRSRR